MKNKFACVHGHFYQPPRENPWLGVIEPEESAQPYRDWNERIFEECYGPNAACPVLGEDKLIVDMADNYRHMSFNFGPTLLSWIEREKPRLYRQILEADSASLRENDGHGGAIAQPYYHAILPLQTLSDKRALVRWGLEDFKNRFKRDSEGLWLPETAVDDETLEVLIEEGLRFTILSPRQAARVRDAKGGAWRTVDALNLQPTRPYLWRSRARPGRSLAVFFYDDDLHQDVVSGEIFAAPDLLARKILARMRPDDANELVHVASDGEFYGHHHKSGATALARTFLALKSAGVQATNYAAFLSRFPPPEEVEIAARTAWSCAHGLGRWTTDCGCRSAHLKSWNQAWRAPLREALDWLARQCDDVYQQARGGLSPEDRGQAARLLEMRRQRLAMFTSCGWFFDDVSGLETVQCLKHAARALELAEGFGARLSGGFQDLLRAAPSNVKEIESGAGAYQKLALPSRVDSARAAVQAALLGHLGWASARAYEWSTQTTPLGRMDKTGPGGHDRSFTAARVQAVRALSGEALDAHAFVYQRDRADLSCWLSSDEDAERIFKILSEDFQRLDDGAFLKRLTETLGERCWKLDALYRQERRDVLRLLMPGPADNPHRKVFLQGWARALARLRANAGSDETLEYLDKAKAHDLAARQLPGIDAVSAHFYDVVVAGAIEEASDAALSRLMRWLEAFEKNGLPVSAWQLRQSFWLWRRKIISLGARPGEREAALAFGERLRFCDSAMVLERTPA